MELSSNLNGIIESIERQPALMVFWAAFGVPLVTAVLGIPLHYLIKALNLQKRLEPITYSLSSTIAISWLLGFVSQMLLLFMEVPGLQMLLIWLTMFLTYFTFSLFNYKSIRKFLLDKQNFKKA